MDRMRRRQRRHVHRDDERRQIGDRQLHRHQPLLIVMTHAMRAALRSVAGRVYWASPHFLPFVRGRVLILMYHRVIPRGDVAATFVQPGMYVTLETFDGHL